MHAWRKFFVTFNLEIFGTFPPSASDALGKVLQTSLKFRNDAGIRDKCDGGWKKRGKVFLLMPFLISPRFYYHSVHLRAILFALINNYWEREMKIKNNHESYSNNPHPGRRLEKEKKFPSTSQLILWLFHEVKKRAYLVEQMKEFMSD